MEKVWNGKRRMLYQYFEPYIHLYNCVLSIGELENKSTWKAEVCFFLVGFRSVYLKKNTRVLG